MPTRSADASWHGSLAKGHGNVRTQSGALEGAYSAPSRFADGDGTNPEELLGAALAGCYAMALSNLLGEHGYNVDNIDARAEVTIETIDGQPSIRSAELKIVGYVADIDENEFNRLAEDAKAHCPVSQALGGLDPSVTSELGA